MILSFDSMASMRIMKQRLERFVGRKRLESSFPFLRNYDLVLQKALTELEPRYKEYIKNVIDARITISLETATFLQVFCEGFRPRSVLDLGSGFSSFVFRSYAERQGNVEVVSVDDHPEWLKKTRAYLQECGVSDANLHLWSDFSSGKKGHFDLVFHDLGNLQTRRDALPFVIDSAFPRKGVVVLDDIHKTGYWLYFNQIVPRYFDYRFLSGKPFTLDKFGRFAGLIVDVDRNKIPIMRL